jgi:hypothetical protein
MASSVEACAGAISGVAVDITPVVAITQGDMEKDVYGL